MSELDEVAEIYNNLTFKKQKYIKLSTSTNLTDEMIADSVGVALSTIKSWSRDEQIKKIKGQVNMMLFKDSVNQTRAQTKYLRDLVFNELTSRFDDPDKSKEELEQEEHDFMRRQDLPEKYKLMQANTRAKNASFGEIIKAMKEVNNLSRMEDEVVGSNEASLEEKVRMRFSKLERKKWELKGAAEAQGLSIEDYHDLVKGSVAPQNASGMVEVLQDGEEQTIEVEIETSVEVEVKK